MGPKQPKHLKRAAYTLEMEQHAISMHRDGQGQKTIIAFFKKEYGRTVSPRGASLQTPSVKGP